MELASASQERYAEYESLLLERDRLRKEAEQAMRRYIAEFGELMAEVFRKKISCIEKKKMLAICLQYVNRGEPVDLNAMQAQIAAEMESYREQLEGMVADYESARGGKSIAESEFLRIRQIYRRIARRIHPDLNPETADDPVLSELWAQVSSAYRCNQLKELEELEILVSRALGDAEERPAIPDIDRRITALYEECETIRTTDPYLYTELLDDPEAVAEKREALNDELQHFTDYEKELQKQLRKLIAEGGTLSWTS